MASTQNCLFVDFETRSRLSLEGGSFKYAQDPSTEILLIGYCWEDEEKICFEPSNRKEREKFYNYIRGGCNVIAHNFLFEIPIILYQGHKYDWPDIPLSSYRCTMQMAGRAGLPLALEYAGQALELEDQKLGFGRLLIQKFCVPKSDGTFNEMSDDPRGREQFMEYCADDAVVSREIWRNLLEWTPSELKDVLFDLQNNVRGLPVDVDAARVILKHVNTELAQYSKRLSSITKGRITKVTQVQRIKQWAQNYVNKDIPSCDAAHIEEILAGSYGQVDDITRDILEMRQHGGKTSTAKYVKFIDCEIAYYIYGMQISFGAHTGRAISKLFNLYNLPKPSVEYESMESLVDQLLTGKHPQYVKAASTAIRGMIRATRGKVLCTADYAAIEARIVFWLANALLGIRNYEKGLDQYVEMAKEIYNHQQIGESERWLGKQAILGCGYGLGAKGFVNSCLRWGVEVSLDMAETAVYAYRNTYPEVVEMWNDLEEAALTACRTGKVTYACQKKIAFKTRRTKSGTVQLLCKLPSGRCLTYPSVKLAVVTTPWGARKTAVTYKKSVDRGFYRDSTYGGKLCENICQGIARDLMYYGAQQAEKLGYETLFTVYDEVIAISDETTANMDEFCEALCTKPNWADGLPMKAEGKLQNRYEKL